MTGPIVKKTSWIAELLEILVVVIQVVVVLSLLQIFFFQLFLIPSGSMRPTLLVGDYVFVTKYNYGYSKASLPFSLPFFSGRIWSKLPERGDIVVFKHKNAYNGESQVYIKRVIGLPGDKIYVEGGVVYINDIPVKRKWIGKISDRDYTGVAGPVDVYQETLPNGVSYNSFSLWPDGPGNNTRSFEVPKDHVFMMGDNRDDSEDSRFSLGYIPLEELIGKARFLYFSLANDSPAYMIWRWPSDMRLSRLFSSVNQRPSLADKLLPVNF